MFETSFEIEDCFEMFLKAICSKDWIAINSCALLLKSYLALRLRIMDFNYIHEVYCMTAILEFDYLYTVHFNEELMPLRNSTHNTALVCLVCRIYVLG